MNSPFRICGCFFLFCLFISFVQPVTGQAGNDIQAQIEQHKASVRKYQSEGNKNELARNYTRLGYLYWQISAELDAINYFSRSIEVNQELGNQNALKTLYNNLGLIYSEREEYQKAIKNFEKSLELNLKKGKTAEAASDYLNIALCFQSLGYYAESNSRAKQALEKALEENSLEMVKTSYGIMGENYDKLGNSNEAAGYYEKYNSLSKHLQQKEMEAMASKTEQYARAVQSKEKQLRSTQDTLGEVLEMNREMQLQNALLNKENQLKEEQAARLRAEKEQFEAKEKARKTQIIYLIAVLILFGFILALVYIQFRAKKRANLQLKEQNNEIEQQKAEIEKQQKRITDSIQYAQRIQKAVMPPEDLLESNFSDHFIFYRPKDIVSGDFYWTTRKDDLLILAVADSTGHGVPGAFMSMLGVAYLNEIVNKISINKHISTLNADDILNQLREMIITSLHQTGDINEPKDGMDIALCIIDFENKKLQYAGANNPLYFIRDGKITQYKGDKMPISYHQKRDVPFSRHSLNWKQGDMIFLFTDGFIDQFGGGKGMKFMSKQFQELLLRICKQPMTDQLNLLDKAFNEWKGDRTQLDDVLVLGVKLGVKAVSKKGQQAIDLKDKTILIAEDTDINYFLLTAVLKQTRANMVRVKDGKEAVEYIKNNEADLILMDINMPNMNGYEATRQIKLLRRDIPIIVQTAMHLEDESEEAFKAGADDYIAKPIDLKVFMQKMERFLS